MRQAQGSRLASKDYLRTETLEKRGLLVDHRERSTPPKIFLGEDVLGRELAVGERSEDQDVAEL